MRSRRQFVKIIFGFFATLIKLLGQTIFLFDNI